MPVTVEVTVEPSREPVTLQEAKKNLRVDTDADDSTITRLITQARETCERRTGRSFITQTRKFYLDEWPDVIRVPYPPLQSVQNITYVDTDGTTSTVDSSTYRVDPTSRVPRITEAYAETWPAKRSVTNSITVEYKAGYGDNPSDVPEEVRAAILGLVTHWYEIRQPVLTENVPRKVPMSVRATLSGLRVHGAFEQD